ncbi:MAG TPA: hypothetical protein PKD16_19250 [Saprospiraceae bacterium]|jgi:hypothetical protein|nr:hypothetical protein [Saprospiraceae bacterium]HMT72311.1 hypothetical protein [Saprospiraceae bacterium]
MKKTIVFVLFWIVFAYSAYASLKHSKVNCPATIGVLNMKELLLKKNWNAHNITSFEKEQKFFYQIALSCTVLVFYQYNTNVGILMDLINNNPQFWLQALDNYFCPSSPPPSVFYA